MLCWLGLIMARGCSSGRGAPSPLPSPGKLSPSAHRHHEGTLGLTDAPGNKKSLLNPGWKAVATRPRLSGSTSGGSARSPGDVYSTLGLFVRLEPFQKKQGAVGGGGRERHILLFIICFIQPNLFPNSLADCCLNPPVPLTTDTESG